MIVTGNIQKHTHVLYDAHTFNNDTHDYVEISYRHNINHN